MNDELRGIVAETVARLLGERGAIATPPQAATLEKAVAVAAPPAARPPDGLVPNATDPLKTIAATLRVMLGIGEDLVTHSSDIAAALTRVHLQLKTLTMKLDRPGPVRLVIHGECAMATKLEFHFDLPPATAPDVLDGGAILMTYAIGDAPEETIEFTGATKTSQTFRCPRNTHVTCYCRMRDASGNVGAAGPVLDAQVVDTFAPPAPGMVGMTVTGEVEEADPPAPEPTPAPTE